MIAVTKDGKRKDIDIGGSLMGLQLESTVLRLCDVHKIAHILRYGNETEKLNLSMWFDTLCLKFPPEDIKR